MALLSACSQTENSEAIENTAIILECDNDADQGTEKEGWVSILRIYEGNEYQRAIQFYHQEGRFYQPCLETRSQCELAVTSRFIEESSYIGDTHYVTSINRTTGRISQVAYSPTLGQTTIWEGDCVKGVEPDESSTKF